MERSNKRMTSQVDFNLYSVDCLSYTASDGILTIFSSLGVGLIYFYNSIMRYTKEEDGVTRIRYLLTWCWGTPVKKDPATRRLQILDKVQCVKCILTFSKLQNDCASQEKKKQNKKNKPFSTEVKHMSRFSYWNTEEAL
jgi:hypothetical protein